MIKNNKFFVLCLVSVFMLMGCQSNRPIPYDHVPYLVSQYPITQLPRNASEAIDVRHTDIMYGMPVR